MSCFCCWLTDYASETHFMFLHLFIYLQNGTIMTFILDDSRGDEVG